MRMKKLNAVINDVCYYVIIIMNVQHTFGYIAWIYRHDI